MGWLNRQDDEIDDVSSSGAVDEGRRCVSMDDVIGEVADGGGCGASRVFAASAYEWVGRWDRRGNHGLGTRLSEMWGKLQKYPH